MYRRPRKIPLVPERYVSEMQAELVELSKCDPATVPRKVAIDASLPLIRDLLEKGFSQEVIAERLQKFLPDISGAEIRARVHAPGSGVPKPQKVVRAKAATVPKTAAPPAKTEIVEKPKPEPEPAHILPAPVIITAPAPAQIEVAPVAVVVPEPLTVPVEKDAAPRPGNSFKEPTPTTFEAPAFAVPKRPKWKMRLDEEYVTEPVKCALNVLGAQWNSAKKWYEIEDFQESIADALGAAEYAGKIKINPLI